MPKKLIPAIVILSIMIAGAILAPFLSRSAFVATVEPWIMLRKQDKGRNSLMPSRMAREGFLGIDLIFFTKSFPFLLMTKSVKVPPVSMPTRISSFINDIFIFWEGWKSRI